MIDYLGPLLIVLGPICITLGANLDRFFSPPDTKPDDIKELERDHVSMTLSKIFKTTKAESFDNPIWVDSFQKYYHENIKALRDAESHLHLVSVKASHMKTWIVLLGITFLLIGTTYTASVNLEIVKDPENLILVADVALIFFFVSEMIFISICFRRYCHNKQKVTEILKSQKLLLTGVFVYGSEESGEDQRS